MVRICCFHCHSLGSIPGWRTEIPKGAHPQPPESRFAHTSVFYRRRILKMWSLNKSNISIPWLFVRKADSEAQPQTYGIRICILTQSPNDACAHQSLRRRLWRTQMATLINSTFQSSVTDSRNQLCFPGLSSTCSKKQISTPVMLDCVQSVKSIIKHRTEKVLTGRDLQSNLCSLQTYDSESPFLIYSFAKKVKMNMRE